MRFDEQLLNRLQAAPGVEVVSVANSLPVRGQTDITLMNLGPGKNEQAVGVHSVSSGYFRIFRIRLDLYGCATLVLSEGSEVRSTGNTVE